MAVAQLARRLPPNKANDVKSFMFMVSACRLLHVRPPVPGRDWGSRFGSGAFLDEQSQFWIRPVEYGFTVIGNGPGGGWFVGGGRLRRAGILVRKLFERTKPIFSKPLEINGFPVTCGGAACRSMPIADTKAPTWFFVFFICSLDGAWVAETRRARFGESRGSFDYRIALGRRAALLLR